MKFQDWGLIDYEQALNRQLHLLEQVYKDKQEIIVFCTHPPVVTLGRASKPEDLQSWDGDVVETSRGGRATYHGPGQLVIYPLINLDNKLRSSFKKRDIHEYLRHLERVLIETLHKFAIKASVRLPEVNNTDSRLSYTGVWVGEKKIASIGIAVKKWITYHGAAINIMSDEKSFTGITPCGFSTSVMTSLEDLGVKVNIDEFKKELMIQFKNHMS